MSRLAPSRIRLLTTGGTIASEVGDTGTKRYDAPNASLEKMIKAAAKAGNVELGGEDIASIGSQDIDLTVWRRLVDRILASRNDDSADGVVVTHGTDTLEETAFLLDLVLAPGRPVVVTGAMRPANAPSSDGPQNLIAAVRVAGDPASSERGVLVAMNGHVLTARGVTKQSTTALDAFQSLSDSPVGLASAKARFFAPATVWPLRGRFTLPVEGPLPKVAIVYAHADDDAVRVEEMCDRGYVGLVLAGVGDGNASTAILAALGRAAASGVLVVRASRIAGGRADRRGEVDDAGLGLVAGRAFSPHKARLLVQMLIVAGVADPARAQAAFDA